MAKLKAPLFSFSASGKLADSLVYMTWKGINDVRQYVVPANPKTAAQTIQRGYVTAAVAAIHTAQALAASPLGAIDAAAYSLWGSTFEGPRTWFNQIVKNWLDQRRLAKIPIIYRGAVLTPAPTAITLKLLMTEQDSVLNLATVRWGTTPTNLLMSQGVTKVELAAGIAITGMVTGTKYYLQVRPTLPTGFIGSFSGIYYATTT